MNGVIIDSFGWLPVVDNKGAWSQAALHQEFDVKVKSFQAEKEQEGNADVLAPCQKSARERKNTVFLSNANQTPTLLIW